MHDLSIATLIGGSLASGGLGFFIRHFLFPKLEAQARAEISLEVGKIGKELTKPEDKAAILAVYAAFKTHFPDAEGALPAMVADAIVARLPKLRPERDLILKELTDFQALVKTDVGQAVAPPLPSADAPK